MISAIIIKPHSATTAMFVLFVTLTKKYVVVAGKVRHDRPLKTLLRLRSGIRPRPQRMSTRRLGPKGGPW
jgi:hypothetical protein